MSHALAPAHPVPTNLQKNTEFIDGISQSKQVTTLSKTSKFSQFYPYAQYTCVTCECITERAYFC